LRTKYPLLPISMADQYKLTQEADDLKRLSDRRYGQGMLILDLLFLKQLLKPFQVVVAVLMTYDIINLIPQQVRLSICKQRSYIIPSLLGSVSSQACAHLIMRFQLTIATNV